MKTFLFGFCLAVVATQNGLALPINGICSDVERITIYSRQGPMTPVFQSEPDTVRRFRLADQDRVIARQGVEKIPLREDKIAYLFESYLRARLGSYPASFQRTIRTMVARASLIESDGGEASCFGGAYTYEKKLNFLMRIFRLRDKGRIYILGPNRLQRTISYYKTLVHEMEHAIQRLADDTEIRLGAKTENLTPEWYSYFKEFGSMRAEWEWLSLMPSELLVEEVAILKDRQAKAPDQAAAEFSASTFEDFRFIDQAYGSYERTKATYEKLGINQGD